MIARIARTAAIACVVMAVLYAAWRGDALAGAAVIGGGLLIGFAFWAITSTVSDLIGRIEAAGANSGGAKVIESGQKRASFPLVKFFTRHAIVAVAAYGMMVRLHLDPMALLAGVSSLGIAVAVEALRDLRWRRFL